MSRIGKKSIILPGGTTASVEDSKITIKGAKGELSFPLLETISIRKEEKEGENFIFVETSMPSENSAMWGTTRAIIANMVHGVSDGWTKILELNGVGFKMNLQGKILTLNLGFSHEVKVEIPEGLDLSLEGNTLTISGIDKHLVGKVAAEIRSLKKAEPYKGKGFKYHDEIVRRKAGKTAKAE